MDEKNRPMTKREIKAIRRLEKLDKDRDLSKQNKVKWILLAVGSLLFLAFFGVLVILAKQNNAKSSDAVSLSDAGWTKGVAGSKITLVEFADFQCPACRVYHPIVKEVLASYKDGTVKFVFKHFPLISVHPNAFAAAKAAEAAGAQGKFFEYHDILYEKQTEWVGLVALSARDKFVAYAQDLELDMKKFEEDFDKKETEAKIRANMDEGINIGVAGTPTFFINGVIVKNPENASKFKKLVDEELK